MRFSEALAITPADFDFSHQILSVSQTWNYKAGGGFSPGTDFPCHLGFRENDWAYQYVDYRYRFGQYVFQKDFILLKNLYGYGFPSAFLPFYLPFADFCAQQDKRFSGQSRPFPRELFKCHGSSGRRTFPSLPSSMEKKRSMRAVSIFSRPSVLSFPCRFWCILAG